MSIREKIERLVEERQAEAARKDITRKLKAIVRVLGYAVQSQIGSGVSEGGYGYFASEALDDGWASDLEDDNEDELPITELDTCIRTVAMYFDGMSSGINLQIWYNDEEELLKVTFEGDPVYREERSRLISYIPSDKWETPLESLFTLAEKRVKLKIKEDNDDKKERQAKTVRRIVDHLRKTWGY